MSTETESIADLMVAGVICRVCGCALTPSEAAHERECTDCRDDLRPFPRNRHTAAIDRAKQKCEQAGFTLAMHNDTHWQIKKDKRAIIDVWPTTSKWRPLIGKNPKTHSGVIEDALRYAAELFKPISATRAEPTKQAVSRRDYFACEAMAALITRSPYAIKIDDGMIREAYRIADAMEQQRGLTSEQPT